MVDYEFVFEVRDPETSKTACGNLGIGAATTFFGDFETLASPSETTNVKFRRKRISVMDIKQKGLSTKIYNFFGRFFFFFCFRIKSCYIGNR